jgi:hypothetical protein
MPKVWVLDSETKGTGAHVAPLEAKPPSAARERELVLVPLERPPRPAPEPQPRRPRHFKIVDVRSNTALAEDVTARGAIETLERVRSIVDAHVYVWEPRAERWRLLTLDEQRAMWQFRRRSEAPSDARHATAAHARRA